MKMRSIIRRLVNWVSLSTYAIWIHPSLSAADSVTIENILDLSVFGTCNINFKKFREDQRTVHLTETLILVQQKLRKDYALTSVENATGYLPMVSPVIGLFEGCVLHVIVGIVPSDRIDEMRLDVYMLTNPYTYTLAPFSTYILIFESV
jgi:hypothetical protein